MLKFENVSFGFGTGKQPLLNNINFGLAAGEFGVLLGENGAGKSTLLRLCNGLLKPQSGTITVCGNSTSAEKTSLIAKSAGFLFQNPDRQLCQKTVREELEFGLRLHGKTDELSSECDEILEEFGLNPDDDPFSLSSGMRQYAAIASVLVCRPSLLLLDEPTSWLDATQTKTFLSVVKKRQQSGTAVLMITHDIKLANRAATRTFTLQQGQLSA
ncbi:MAG: energy-coupling factor ABC transporter ATP-binding protein [Oscillospiraceae bacterium]|jgi:energy-coupling factor transport system ATP-binding protein|nr:energy-coupling factor ABC transporter ATP-binding protein [Oscillospiraceae bacterium]